MEAKVGQILYTYLVIESGSKLKKKSLDFKIE